jgi:hypothetical protein
VEREQLLSLLWLMVCGPIVLAGAMIPSRLHTAQTGIALARQAARCLLLPLLPAALAAAGLIGWALQEPDAADESLETAAILAALPFCVIVLRACARAVVALVRSQIGSRAGCPACTIGLLRPRVLISSELAEVLDADELRAVREHEAAHARHRDPLRIICLRFAADLQWPVPSAARRYLQWRCALELACDEEARAHGVDGEDLASGILATARLMKRRCDPLRAALTVDDGGDGLRDRIQRLLQPLAALPPRSPSRWPLFVTAAMLLVGLVGSAFGEAAVRSLPGVVW